MEGVGKMKQGCLLLISVLLLFFSACTSQDEIISSQLPDSQESSFTEKTGNESASEVEEENQSPSQEISSESNGFLMLPQDNGTLAPKNMLENALLLTQPEVEAALGVTLSEDSKNPRSGGYLVDCDVSFGKASATQVDLQFNKVNQEDEDLLLLAVGYQFAFEAAEEGWNAFQAMAQDARSQGARSVTEEYYGQESGFVRYDTFEEFDAGARESAEKSGLPTVECVDLFYVDEQTTCEYNFTYAPDQGFIATVYYGADVTRSVDGGNSLK